MWGNRSKRELHLELQSPKGEALPNLILVRPRCTPSCPFSGHLKQLELWTKLCIWLSHRSTQQLATKRLPNARIKALRAAS